MKPNRDIGHDIIFGPFLIVGNDFENGGYNSIVGEMAIFIVSFFALTIMKICIRLIIKN